MFNLIRRLSRPVADNVLSKSVTDNVIANLVANGLVYLALLAVSWVATHSAQVKWPLYQVIIFATVLFLLLALTINLIHLVIVRHLRLARELKQDFGSVSPAPQPSVPNLVALEPKQVLVGEDETFFECETDHSLLAGSAAVAVIRNQGGAGRVAVAQRVRAHIEYSPVSGGGVQKHSVDNGVWVNAKEIFRDFAVGHTEKLILAVEKLPHKEVFAYENNYLHTNGESLNLRLRHKLVENAYIVTVQLIGGNDGDIEEKFYFRLATQPNLRIEKLDTTDSRAAKAVFSQSATVHNGLLGKIANEDQASINKAVKVCDIKCTPHFEKGSAPYLEFSFLVFNISIFEITIDDDVTGYITFHGQKFHHPIQMKENHVKELSIRSLASYELHQPVTEQEAAAIENADENWLFWFSGLNVRIKGGSRFQNVSPRLLEMNKSIRKGDLHWIASFYDIVE